MKILIAVDSSNASHYAAQVAQALFPDAERVVLSAVVFSPHTYVEPLAGGMFQNSPTMAELNASESIAEKATDSAVATLGSVDKVLNDIGDPGRVICEEAKELAVDVIVVGRADKKWLDRLFEPSVSDYVMKHAPCPVLVVREPTEVAQS
jgi:nucleotide-binding universal stress UspA family protein